MILYAQLIPTAINDMTLPGQTTIQINTLTVNKHNKSFTSLDYRLDSIVWPSSTR